MQRILLSIVIALFIAPFNIHAAIDNNRYIVDLLSTQNGLPNNDVQDIMQDSYGYIWAATYDGICRYDGYDFVTYSIGDLGLTSNMILALEEDKEGNIWIGTTDKGLYCYIRSENYIYHYSEFVSDYAIEFESVRRIVVDSDNNIWCYDSQERRVVRLGFNHETKTIESIDDYTLLNSDFEYVFYILATPKELYLATRGGVYRYSNESDSFTKIENTESISPARWISKIDNTLFIANLTGLYTIDLETNERVFQKSFSSQCYLSWLDDTLWCVSSDGLYKARYNSSDGSFEEFELIDKYDNESPATISTDHAKGVWVSFSKAGIRRYEHNNTPFYTNQSVGHRQLLSISKIGGEKLMIGARQGGLHELSTVDSEARNIDLLSGENPLSICENGDEVFISTNNALYKLYGQHWSKIDTMLNNIHIRKVTIDGDYMWLAHYNDGLKRYNMKSGSYRSVSGLPSNIVRNVILDRDENVWICTKDGVAIIDSAARFDERPAAKLVLDDPKDNNYTIPIIEDSRGSIWYGTIGYGLYRLDRDGREYKATSFTKEDGLPTNIISAIEEDDNGDIWVSSSRGLSKLEVDNSSQKGVQIINYDLSDGLHNVEFLELSSAKLSDGTLVFGGVDGFTYFKPSDFTINRTDVIPVISDLKIDGRSIYLDRDIDKIIGGDILSNGGIRLKYSQNNFSLKLAGLNYSAPLKCKYKYYIERYNQDWIALPAMSREILFPDMNPGRYTLHVKISNSKGEWMDEALIVPIQIEYPIWLKWYAIVIYMLILAIIIYYAVLYMRNVARRRNAIKIANLERQKSEEMLEMRTRFFTNVSHEFRTPLTLILSPMQRLMEDERILANREWVDLLDTMSHNGDSLMRLINEFLSYTKQESGELKAQLGDGDIAALGCRLFSQFTFWANSRGITLNYTAPKSSVMVAFDPYLMEQVIYNLVSNAIKYTPSGGEITMSIVVDGANVIISIKDNGCGVPEEQQHLIFTRYFSRASDSSRSIGGTGVGLYLTRKLVELHNGKIGFESKVDLGSTFTVELPLSSGMEVDSELNSDMISPAIIESNEEDLSAHPTLLIVDDNIELLRLLNTLFCDRYRVLTAMDGKEGLEIATNLLPDIIISDVMMPNMDGIELCERLKGDIATSHIPVILLSAKASDDDIAAGLRATADGYCPKPFSNNVLKEMVGSTLANRQKIAAGVKQAKKDSTRFVELSQTATTNLDRAFIAKLTKYIEDHIDNSEMNATEICEYMGLSSFLLNKKLKSLLNMTIIVFIRTIRLRRAAELLKNPQNTIAEVTYDVGFSDLKYFRRCFKDEFGVLPQEYKNQHTT